MTRVEFPPQTPAQAPAVTTYYAVRAGRRNGELVYNVVQTIHSDPPTYRAQFWVGPDSLPTPGQDFATRREALEACCRAGAWELRRPLETGPRYQPR